jgi:large repetitive protein
VLQRLVLARGLKLTVLASGLMLAICSSAWADRAFAPRFDTNASGDITIVGNTLETCQASVANCLSARAGTGTALNNNNFVMERVDVDRTMLDSSSAKLSLPFGARVLFAGLYYGARTNAGTGGKSVPTNPPPRLNVVDLKLPGASTYERLTGQLDQSTDVTGAYGVFVDVTDQVQRGGPGIYTVANVQSATGEDRYAGWALVVAYEAAGEPPRNLTVFDGLQSVTQGKSALTIPVSGFKTPPSGPVRTKLGFIAYEGDLGLTGDSASLDGKPLTDAVNPANNFFNSTISADGRNRTDKNPDYVNQLGFDANLIGLNGILANGATSANIALKTTSDQYLPHAITFATDLYAPIIRATKTVANLTHPGGPNRPGDTLRYTVTYTNDGLDAARGFVAEDVLPSETTYLAGSLRIPGAPAAIASPSDLPGDDLGEYDAAARKVRFFLGAGAAPGVGGSLAAAGQPGSTVQVSFDARVDENLTEVREITDVASATFIASSLNKQLSALSSPATIKVEPLPVPPPPEADLASAQTETVAPSPGGGDVVDSHILIEDHGPADATDVIMHATVPPGAVIDSVTTDQGSCSIAGNEVTCVVPHMDSGGSVDVNIVVIEPTADTSTGSITEATVDAAQFDPTPANNSSEASAPAPAPPGATPAAEAALAVDVHDSSARTPLGGTETEAITITNGGPDTATGVDVTDALGAAAELIAVNPGGASCAPGLPVQCTIDTLPAGSSQTIDVEVRPLRPGHFIAAASVSGDQANPHLASDFAMIASAITPRRTAARLRVVPVRPVTKAGQTVEFVVTAGVTRPVPGVMPKVCVALPPGLRLISLPPDATSSASMLCRPFADLISGRPQSFRFRARVGAVPSGGANFSVRGRLTGSNFAPTGATAALLAPPPVVACPSRATPDPWGRLAC